MPYGKRPQKRILVQLFLTTTTGLLVIILLTELVSLIARGHTAPLSFYLFDVFIFVIWFIVINGIYVGLHYYQEWKQSEHHRQEEKKIRVNGYSVKQGKQNLLIRFEEISGFYKSPYNDAMPTEASACQQWPPNQGLGAGHIKTPARLRASPRGPGVPK